MAYSQFDQPAEVLGGALAETQNRRALRAARPNDATDSRVIHQHKEET